METKVKSNGNRYICPECKNENIIPEGSVVGDILECEFCGIELEIVEVDQDGNYTLSVIEEEK